MTFIDGVPPEKRTDDVRLVAGEADTYAALAAINGTEGGQILTKSLAKDVVAAIEDVVTRFAIMPETELRAVCAKLSANLSLYRAISNAQSNLDATQQELDELLDA